jgi:hypothetical protein
MGLQGWLCRQGAKVGVVFECILCSRLICWSVGSAQVTQGGVWFWSSHLYMNVGSCAR